MWAFDPVSQSVKKEDTSWTADTVPARQQAEAATRNRLRAFPSCKTFFGTSVGFPAPAALRAVKNTRRRKPDG